MPASHTSAFAYRTSHIALGASVFPLPAPRSIAERCGRIATLCMLLSLPLLAQKRAEDEDYFKKWLESDVAYLITDEERAVFDDLTTEEEKVRFIEAFWKRRDTTPATADNPFKDEHYRRIAYANERFSAGMPGWRTDRGRVYIQYGPPAQIDVYPMGTTLSDIRSGVAKAFDPAASGEFVRPRETSTFPFEVWRYRYIEGLGSNVNIEFVDRSGAGLYRLALDNEDKNAFAYMDPAADVTSVARSDFFARAKDRQFERTEINAALHGPPAIQFNDLREVVTARVQYDALPIRTSVVPVPVTDASSYVYASLTLPASYLDFETVGDQVRASANIYIQATSLQKRIEAVAEDTLQVTGSSGELANLRKGHALFQKKLLLGPGRYALDFVVKDEKSGKVGTSQELVVVPALGNDLTIASVMLADVLRPLGEGEDLTDPFAVGDHHVIPNVAGEFEHSKRLGLYFQILGMAIDQASLEPQLEVEVRFRQGEREIAKIYDELNRFGRFRGDRAHITIALPLEKFPTGRIDVEMSATDKLSGKSVQAKTSFKVVEG